MEELLEKLKNIISRSIDEVEYTGVLIYLLTSEETPYKAYILNIEENIIFENILSSNISRIKLDNIDIYNYIDISRPEFPNEISHLDIGEIPMYQEIINSIELNSANRNILTKRNINEVISKSKGYVIQVLYNEAGEDKSIYSYFRMTKSAFLTGHDKILKFSDTDGSLLQENKEPQLKFGDKLVSVAIDNTMFILNGYDFELLLKYEELINEASIQALNNIESKLIIANFDSMKEYCLNNIQMKRKLYKIKVKGNIDNITIDDFKEAKNICGEHLSLIINENNDISFDEDNRRQSIDHILRIYNDEGAETIISKKPIFADKKIEI